MSGLIFIFIITLAVFALRLARAIEEQDEITKRLQSANEVRAALLENLRRSLEEEGIAVKIDLKQGVLRLTDRAIGFDRGSADPQPPANVGTVASVLLRVLPDYVACVAAPTEPLDTQARSDFCNRPGPGLPVQECTAEEDPDPKVDTVLIEGHTDSVPIHSWKFKDNLALSAARSSEVFRMMTEDCEPDLSRLRNRSGKPVMSVSGYGETRPIEEGDLEADANRRIDLRFLMELPQQEEVEPARATREELAS